MKYVNSNEPSRFLPTTTLFQSFFAIIITEPLFGGKLGKNVQYAKKIIRHFILYTLDFVASLIHPECRILSRMPLDVFYSRVGKFRNHPLNNFLVKWDMPSISSTYSALTILRSFQCITTEININYATSLMLEALRRSYSSSSGAFVDYATKLPDFRATYYAIRAIRLLEETTSMPKNHILQEIGINQEMLCDFLLKQGQTSKCLYDWEKIEPNFSILEKSLTSINYINQDIFRNSYFKLLNKMTDYIMEDKGKIKGFKLHYSDKQPSLSANKSGILLLGASSVMGSHFLMRPENLEIESIFKTTYESIDNYEKNSMYSYLFNIYNTVVTLNCIEEKYELTNIHRKYIDKFYEIIDGKLDNMNNNLNYKGGFLFNVEYYSAPNLYASRLFVEILSRRSKLNIINKKKLENFIYDTYDFQSGQFRNYPYRSWYYSRNISMAKNTNCRPDYRSRL